MIGPFIESSLNTLFKAHEVTQFAKFATVLADNGTGVTSSEEQAGFSHGATGLVVLGGVYRRHSVG